MTKTFPRFMTDLPEIDVPMQGVRGWLMQAPSHQVVFFEIEPIGGTFWNLGSRSLYLLSHFEGPRFALAVLLSPIFGFLIPLACYYLDKLDRRHWDTLGYRVVATKRAA